MEIKMVSREDIINSILDRINEGEKITQEMKNILMEMSDG